MASGRSPDRGRPGDDEYDWLYSGTPSGTPGEGSDRAGDDAEVDDSTRMLPQFDRRTGRTAAGRPAPGAPPAHIAPTPPGGSRAVDGTAGAPHHRRFRLRWVVYLLLLWLLFLVAVPVYAWTSVSQVDAAPDAARPSEQPGTTYLVVGSDARSGLAGGRTDTIMLLHTGDGPDVLVSLPRDSLVDVPGHGVTKINAAFTYGGPELLVQTVEQATGLRMDGYVEIGFTGLVRLVDAVGGVEICPETAIVDPQAELDIPAGCQQADGATALGYARSRKSQELGDIDRARHQREVVAAIGSEVVSWQTVLNPVRYWRVVNAGAESVRVGSGTGPVEAARFALAMTQVDGENGLTCGVPISDLEVNWDRERADQLFTLIAEDRTDAVGRQLCRPTGMPQ